MKNNIVKGLFMTIVAFLGSYIGDNVESGINIQYVIISTIGISMVYIGKNFIYQSVSAKGNIDVRDALSGLIVSIGTAISSGAASFIVNGSIDWKAMGLAVIAVIVGYFGKTAITDGKR